jgi:arylformamidase
MTEVSNFKRVYIDITHDLDDTIAVWPGDQSFQYRLGWSMAEGSSCNVGSVIMSCHTGTHADAPFHYTPDGKRMGEMPLEVYDGPCRVVEIPAGSESVLPVHVAHLDLTATPRILFKTGSYMNRVHFPEKVTSIHPDTVHLLQEKGVILLGTDAPSVDPLNSKELAAHHALYRSGMAILESLKLDAVKPGSYEITAFPLKLKDGDGSPVRAVLKTIE